MPFGFVEEDNSGKSNIFGIMVCALKAVESP